MNIKSFIRIAAASGLALAVFSVAAQNAGNSRSAQGGPRPSPAPALATTTLADVAKTKDANAEQFLAQAAVNAGLRTCKPLADRVNRYLIAESQSSGLLSASPENANARIFSSTIEIETRQGTTTYASTTYAPYGDTGCGVAYDAVTYWKESCTDLAAKQLSNLKVIGTLGSKITMLDGGPAMRMFLMPAGTGCVQIKKEIVY